MQIKIHSAAGVRSYQPSGCKPLIIPERSMVIIENEEAEKLVKSDSWNLIKLQHKVEVINQPIVEKILVDLEPATESEPEIKPEKKKRK